MPKRYILGWHILGEWCELLSLVQLFAIPRTITLQSHLWALLLLLLNHFSRVQLCAIP